MKPELVARNETRDHLLRGARHHADDARQGARSAARRATSINVLNVQSKRTVQATVTGPGRVTVIATRRASRRTPSASPPPSAPTERRSDASSTE